MNAFLIVVSLLSLILTGCAWAKEKPQSQAVFLAQVFGTELPQAEMIRLSEVDKTRIKGILQHPLTFQRVRYWKKGSSAVWLLDEVGKHKPITAAFWLENGVIKKVKVLAFRETRGWEIKYPYFLKQFRGISLLENNTLSAKVDGISGATLSVRAMKKMAYIALYLNQQINKTQSSQLH